MFNIVRKTLCQEVLRSSQVRTRLWFKNERSLSTATDTKNNTDYEDKNEDRSLTTTTDIKNKLADTFPNYFHDGVIHNRSKYHEFVYDALKRLEELGIHKDLNVYKELIKVFPVGPYLPGNYYSRLGLFSAPQQLCVLTVLFEMERHQVFPDKEMERLIVDRFSRFSDCWLKITRMIYWSMKFRSINPWPLPDVAPDSPVELTKLALSRMCLDKKTMLSVWNTSRIPTSVDKTWVVSAQSDIQQDLIDKLEKGSILYIEEGGRAYIRNKYINYYVLKKLHDQPQRLQHDPEEPEHDYQSMTMQFFGKPIKEKEKKIVDMHNTEDGYILAIVATGTSSPDSLDSWITLLQERNPRLKEVSFFFQGFKRPIRNLVDISTEANN